MVVTTEEGILVASNKYNPGMLLNTLQYTGQPSAAMNYPTQNVNSAEAKKPFSREQKKV